MILSVKQRLKDFIKSENISITKFETSINASNGYVNSISKGIGKDKLEKIIEVYPNLDVVWLLTGESQSLNDSIHQGTSKNLLSEDELKKLALKVVMNEDQLMTIKAFSNIIEIRVAKKIATLLSDEKEYIKWRNS